VIRLIDQDRTAFQEIQVPFDNQINGRLQEWVAGADESSQRFSGGSDKFLLKGDSFITL
jgi:hypothetical protein